MMTIFVQASSKPNFANGALSIECADNLSGADSCTTVILYAGTNV